MLIYFSSEIFKAIEVKVTTRGEQIVLVRIYGSLHFLQWAVEIAKPVPITNKWGRFVDLFTIVYAFLFTVE